MERFIRIVDYAILRMKTPYKWKSDNLEKNQLQIIQTGYIQLLRVEHKNQMLSKSLLTNKENV